MTLQPADRTLMASAALVTISTVLPGFLVGALSVQVQDDFGLSEAVYGWGTASFFLAATAGSFFLGTVAQRIGPRRQVSISVGVSLFAQVCLAAFAESFGVMLVCLAVCGIANAANQTGINLLLTRAQLPRLGLAIALKQSGMPTASMLAGLGVPLIALTVGWRWAYVASAVFGTAAILWLRRRVAPIGPMASSSTGASTETPTRTLVIAATAFVFLAAGAGTLVSWLVASAVDAGMGEGTAGLLLSASALCGVIVRLSWGVRLDSMRLRPFRVAAAMCVGGAAGIALLAFRAPSVHVAAALLAFGSGWIWPVFTNFGIVRANQAAAATATGITQTGVYVGIVVAPLASGWLIESQGYPTMWLATAVCMLIGSALTFTVADDF